jgi:site-specific DNA recombinase
MPEICTVAVYARVSSERQARDNTIASQLHALRQRVHDDGCAWNDDLCFVDDGCSGSTLLRPALERLRDAAANGLLERLYVQAPDRLARCHAYQILLVDELRRLGIEVVFLNRAIGSSAEDELLLQVQGVIAEYERAKIQERNRRGKRHRAQHGAVSVFSTAPYGYRYVAKAAGTPARFEILPDEAAVVEQIFTWVAEARCSIREACSRLKKQGVVTRNGKRDWSTTTVRRLLRNPAYSGQAAYGKTRYGERQPRLRPQRGHAEVPRRPSVAQPRPREEWLTVAVPAIVSSALFDAVAEQLHDNRRRHRARPPRVHLLQGLLVCQCCGYSCYLQSARAAAGKTRYGYYRCIGCDRHRGDDGRPICQLPRLPQQPLEDAVWNDVHALLANPERIQAEYQRRAQEHSRALSPQREQLDRRRQRATQTVRRLIDAYSEGLLDKTEFEPRVRAAKQRLSEIDAEHKLLLEQETRDQHLRAVIQHLDQFAQRVHQGLDGADATLRRELICALVKRVELGMKEVRIVYRIPLNPFDQGPTRGHLRHWAGRFNARHGRRHRFVASRSDA